MQVASKWGIGFSCNSLDCIIHKHDIHTNTCLMQSNMLNTIIIISWIKNDCACVISLIILWFQLFLPPLIAFLPMPGQHHRCCFCTKRVDTKGTYTTIGSDTVDKLQPHTRGDLVAGESRSCNKCYKHFTRNQKNKVSTNSGVINISCISISTHINSKCNDLESPRYLGPLFFISCFSCFSCYSCYRNNRTHNLIHLLTWPLLFNIMLIKMMQSTNVLIRYVCTCICYVYELRRFQTAADFMCLSRSAWH